MDKRIALIRRILQYGLAPLLLCAAVRGFQAGGRLEPLSCAAAAILILPPVFERILREREEESWWDVGLLTLQWGMQLEGLLGLAKTPESLNLITFSAILGLVTKRKSLKILWTVLAAVELVLAL